MYNLVIFGPEDLCRSAVGKHANAIELDDIAHGIRVIHDATHALYVDKKDIKVFKSRDGDILSIKDLYRLLAAETVDPIKTPVSSISDILDQREREQTRHEQEVVGHTPAEEERVLRAKRDTIFRKMFL